MLVGATPSAVVGLQEINVRELLSLTLGVSNDLPDIITGQEKKPFDCSHRYNELPCSSKTPTSAAVTGHLDPKEAKLRELDVLVFTGLDSGSNLHFRT